MCAASDWKSLQHDDTAFGLLENPLKGFLPFEHAYVDGVKPSFPHSMEYFNILMKDMMDGPDDFPFDRVLEPLLNRIAERGHQTVLRVVLDYPGQESGVPKYLIDDGLLIRSKVFPELGRNSLVHSPDYDDPRLVEAVEAFLAAFGKKYDGDPRIGFITAGMIGFWGEWHTWPQGDWMASEETQLRVVQAYEKAFRTTKVLLRYPKKEFAQMPMGYHDDSFAFQTLYGEEWFFQERMERAGTENIWRTQPIGGEIRPEIQISMWDNPPDPNAEDYRQCLDITHPSWMLAQNVFGDRFLTEGPKHDRAVAGSKALGYEFVLDAVKAAPSADRSFDIGVKLRNTGIAPFYYDWDVQLGLLDASGSVARTWSTGWKLSELLPGEAELHREISCDGLANASYKLVLKVVNPLATGKPLVFANREQNADAEGWLTLAELIV